MKPDFRKRIRNLQKLIKENKLDSVLLTSQSDVFYYTGFGPDDSAFLVIGKNSGPVLFVSPLNNDAENLKTAEVRFLPDLKKHGEFLKKYKPWSPFS